MMLSSPTRRASIVALEEQNKKEEAQAPAPSDAEVEAKRREEAAEAQRPSDMTPLYAACKHGHAECVKLLLGVDSRASAINHARRQDGTTALHVACEAGAEECVELLIEAGADVLGGGGSEHLSLAAEVSPLFVASTSGDHDSCVLKLLDANAEIDYATAATQLTALMGAAMEGHIQVVSELISGGASTSMTSHEGLNAWELAIRDGNHECAKIIEDAMIERGETEEGKSIGEVGKMHPHALQRVRTRRDSFSRAVAEQGATPERRKARIRFASISAERRRSRVSGSVSGQGRRDSAAGQGDQRRPSASFSVKPQK